MSNDNVIEFTADFRPSDVAIENDIYPPDETQLLLTTRSHAHGNYATTAKITMQTLNVWMDSPNWYLLDYTQQDALDMIARKVARILCGDPKEADHWRDIEGYARLASNAG